MGVEVVAALIYSAALITKGVMDIRSTGDAADSQAEGATSAARIRAGSLQDQIDMANQAARQLRADTEVTRGGNFGQWEADLINTSNLTWDQAENARRAGNILGQNLHNQYWDTEAAGIIGKRSDGIWARRGEKHASWPHGASDGDASAWGASYGATL